MGRAGSNRGRNNRCTLWKGSAGEEGVREIRTQWWKCDTEEQFFCYQ